MRWPALAAGGALTVIAFAAATRVADTREGLIAEVITLLGGMVGLGLLIYGFAARRRPVAKLSPTTDTTALRLPQPRRNRDLVLGAGGIALALVLVSGLALSGGTLWAGFGLALLLPMLAGCVYLCVRYLRASC